MRRIYGFMFFSLLSFSVSANSNFSISLDQGNVHMLVTSGSDISEFENKRWMMLDLADRYVRAKTANQLYVSIDFESIVEWEPASYSLGYGRIAYEDWEEQGKASNQTGILISVKDHDWDFISILALIGAGIDNLDFVKSSQKVILIDRHYWLDGKRLYDTVLSIPFTKVNEYMDHVDPHLEKLLTEKTFRYISPNKETRRLDYYYQDKAFHFYITYPETGYIKDLLVLKEVHEIMGDTVGYFVFANDSICYFIHPMENRAVGPFEIEGVVAGRTQARKYEYFIRPVERFVLRFDNYQFRSTAAYFPHEKRFISNFDKLEKEFFKNILAPENKHGEKDSVMLWVSILSSLSVLVVLIFLAIKRKTP